MNSTAPMMSRIVPIVVRIPTCRNRPSSRRITPRINMVRLRFSSRGFCPSTGYLPTIDSGQPSWLFHDFVPADVTERDVEVTGQRATDAVEQIADEQCGVHGQRAVADRGRLVLGLVYLQRTGQHGYQYRTVDLWPPGDRGAEAVFQCRADVVAGQAVRVPFLQQHPDHPAEYPSDLFPV